MPGLLSRKLSWLSNLFVAAALYCALAATTVLAETPVLSAPAALEQLEAGTLVVLDIRSPQEWAESGVADGAWPVSMHTPDFPDQLRAILARHEPGQIALICATGGRSAYVADVLEKNGVTGVMDISEGMFGNDASPGWIARGLPVSTLGDAAARYDKVRESWE